jgi:hypothetical protein
VSANIINIESLNADDALGSFTVSFKQVLASPFDETDQLALQPEFSFQVTLTACEVTGVVIDTDNSDPAYSAGFVNAYTHLTSQELNFPKYTVVPACLYTAIAMSAKVGSVTLSSGSYTSTVKQTGTGPD